MKKYTTIDFFILLVIGIVVGYVINWVMNVFYQKGFLKWINV